MIRSPIFKVPSTAADRPFSVCKLVKSGELSFRWLMRVCVCVYDCVSSSD